MAEAPPTSSIEHRTSEGQLGTKDVEIRKNPGLLGHSVILVPKSADLEDLQTSMEGQFITEFSYNGNSIQVISPKDYLFALEGHKLIQGVGLYDRVSGFGADERLKVAGPFGPTSLELMIKVFIERTKKLKHGITEDLLRQFYAYGTYRTEDSSLVGRLLASTELAPNVQSELNGSSDYYHFKNRCLHCDIAKQERQTSNQSESRLILYHDNKVFTDDQTKKLLYDDGAIAIVSFHPVEEYNIHIIPSGHKPRLTDLSNQQIEVMASFLYKCLMGISADSKDVGRGVNNLDFVFHSAPFFERNDVYLMRNGDHNVDLYSHSYIEIFPHESSSYEIPGSGWVVAQGRPKDTAARLRKIIAQIN